MVYLKGLIKHAVRFRHKRGYGVHSPFMFNLILNVIRDREGRFAYPLNLEKRWLLSGREIKMCRLLSRLVRYFEVGEMVCIGNDAELLAGYLPEVYREAAILCNRPDRLGQADFIYLGHDSARFLSGGFVLPAFPESVSVYIVIADIYRNTLNRRIWCQCMDSATVSVDMVWCGLLLFDNRIQRGKYSLTI